jgi:hypothetical protein
MSDHGHPLMARARVNVPPLDGEAPADWGVRHDAWQHSHVRTLGHAHGGKEPLPSGVLTAVIDQRLRAIPAVREAQARVPDCVLHFGRPHPHKRDDLGRNWNVMRFELDGHPITTHQSALRRALDALRDEFDLA